MTAIELKSILIKKITDIEDVTLLNDINTIIESKSKTEHIKLSKEQKNEIFASKKEVENGHYIEQNELDKEILGWLNAK
jgi:hypothetical protein